jgi:hypothetical protein
MVGSTGAVEPIDSYVIRPIVRMRARFDFEIFLNFSAPDPRRRALFLRKSLT